MENEDIYKVIIRLLSNLYSPKDGQNNESNSSANAQVIPVASSSMSSTVFIALLTEICEMLKKNKKTRDRVHSNFKDRYGKLKIVDNPCESVAINQLINQFKVLCDVIKTVLTANDIIPNPSNSVSSTRYKNDFEELKFIASGSFGSVYKARHNLDQHEYAIKKICVTREKSYRIIKILEEVKTLARLQHRNIISYRNAWIENGPLDNVPLIADSGDEESPGSSKNIDSHYNSRDNSPPKPSHLSNCFKGLSVRDSKESGCSTNVHIRINVNSDSDSGGSSNSNSSKINICVNNNADFHGQLKPLVINKGISLNDKSIGKSNSSDSTDSMISFREDNNNSSNNSPSSASCSKEINSDDGEKSSTEENYIKKSNIGENSIEENNSKLESHSQQVCEYKPRPDVLTLYIQMALCEQTLRKWLDERNETTETSPVSTINEIYKQILMGLQYIHSRGIVHHDIKPCNIFISTSKKLQIQIGDFGLACLSRETDGHKPVGTEMYAAPEQLNGSCDSKSDLYSLGIILVELIYPTTTFMELNDIMRSLKQGKIPDSLEEQYKKYAEVIIKLLIADPNERPSADDLLEEFETNKDFIIDRLKSEIENKDRDIIFLTDLNIMLLNSLKKESVRNNVRLKRLLGDMKDKHLKKK
ncbi:eukaryotic translation initiation factor 2-alpha kinase 1 [Cotesia typhae]|uniref:eukaryotic translation initiation factor 2-alpha kinase 1 n=1 Tax=Cotesia typhae TaxID=2053667 RepID=UPI003D694D1D